MESTVKLVSKADYESATAKTRDARMAWWREARFGMFIHYGLFSVLGRQEWAMAHELWPVSDYERLTEGFLPKPGCCSEWARLAKAAGMKYMVLTTRHHEGFSLWDSKVNPYNSVNYGPHRDIVAEFVEACRAEGLKVGFYTSLMDWHHPDCGPAAYDSAARKRLTDYILALNTELLSNYGKIDILWYDGDWPLRSFDGWNAVEMNQRLRALQPDIIINNRSHLEEDYGTPEESITPDGKRDWEACMTFNGISWGYVDSEQMAPYAVNANQILRMLSICAKDKGNLLLNIGPKADGSVPDEAIAPLTTLGKWLAQNGEALYGKMDKFTMTTERGLWGVGGMLQSLSRKGSTIYAWQWLWPPNGEIIISGMVGKLLKARILGSGKELPFTQEKYRIIFPNLDMKDRDPILGATVIALDFEAEPEYIGFAKIAPLLFGQVYE
ncbi:MAG: alpha-L-fucosidase [Spirochaetaceae bacterium]|jgi:alpha-L-fucosidase|nr:alpha-L-fucosidase [Spirochaetaceae bacterium]